MRRRVVTAKVFLRRKVVDRIDCGWRLRQESELLPVFNVLELKVGEHKTSKSRLRQMVY
jgi:hypothetical protein